METMLSNIYEEKEVLLKILKEFRERNSKVIDELGKKDIKRVLVLATGSSMNAAQTTKYFLEDILDCFIEIKEPFNFYNYEKIDNDLDLVITITQSGKSSSTIEALKYIKENSKIKTLTITSDNESPVIEYSDLILNLNFGIEKVGFVTKGFSATILNIFLLGIFLGESRKSISKEKFESYLKELEKIINYIPKVIEISENYFEENKETLKATDRFIAIGYGGALGIAKEFETKFTETVRCPSQGFELEAYMHGPYLEANKNHIIFYLENNGKLKNRMKNLREYMDSYVKKSILIGLNNGDINISLEEKFDEHLVLLLLVVPIQLMSYKIATFKGIDLGIRIFNDFDKVLKSKI